MRCIQRTLISVTLLSSACMHNAIFHPTEQRDGSIDFPSTAQSGWRSLFDGTSLDQWRSYTSDSVSRGWSVVDGTIVKGRGARDLMTKQQFANFELELEWKMGKAGNSGIFYRGTTEYDHIYWSAP